MPAQQFNQLCSSLGIQDLLTKESLVDPSVIKNQLRQIIADLKKKRMEELKRRISETDTQIMQLLKAVRSDGSPPKKLLLPEKKSPVDQIPKNDKMDVDEKPKSPLDEEAKKAIENVMRMEPWHRTATQLLNDIKNHKFASLFRQKSHEKHAHIYAQVVKRPIYIETLERGLNEYRFKSLAEFNRDALLMIQNVIMLSKDDSVSSQSAYEMKRFIDTKILV
jgi:hypothetical protein